MTDSVSLRQDSFYEEQGITAISNNNAVVPRDQGGNVLIQPTSSLLIIEAITTNVLAESVLPLLNTQFNYFKFPARTAIVDESLDLDLDLNLDLEIDLETQVTEIESLIPTPPILPSEYKPSSDQRIPLGSWGNPSIIDFSTVITGPNQIKPNSLVVTQELLDELESLRTETDTPLLKITGRIKTRYNATRKSAIGFSIGFANSAIRFTMDSPEDDIDDNGNDIVKAKKDGVYTTDIDTSATLSDLYIGQELQILGWAEDSQDNRNHTILANDSFIKFAAEVI